MQEESSWHDRLSQPLFLKHLNKTHQGIINKTHQGIMCEKEIKIAYIKKHVYKEREREKKKKKTTTHVEIGEKKHTSSSYI